MSGMTPPDRVLENVIGSSVTHRYELTEAGEIQFHRLHAALPDGVRSYVSPDRLHYFRKRHDGLYQHREVSLSSDDEDKIRCALYGHRWEKAWVLPVTLLPVCAPVSEMTMDATVQMTEGRRCRCCQILAD